MTDGPIKSPLVKTYDGEHATKERDQAADDIYDIVMADIQGRQEVGDASRKEDESDARAERLFFEAVADGVTARCSTWLAKLKFNYDGHGTGYHFVAFDREGRQFGVSVTYSELSEVAALQRQSDKNLEHMSNEVARKIEASRAHYFARMSAVVVH